MVEKMEKKTKWKKMEKMSYLQVDDFAKLAEMIVEYGDVVEATRNLLHFQTAVGRIKTASTKTIVIEITLFDDVTIL